MTPQLRSDILNLLKSDLKIEIGTYYDYDSQTVVEISVVLDGDVISTSTVRIQEGE